MFVAVNPADGSTAEICAALTTGQLEEVLVQAAAALPVWQATPVAARCDLVRAAGMVLRRRSEELAQLITQEMGKPILESRAEIGKCALGCDYYAEHGASFLADEPIASDAGRSLWPTSRWGPYWP